MESCSHLSLILDLSPSAWYQSSMPPPANTYPLSLSSFLPQVLAFLNSHLAQKADNSLAVFGAFPGESVLLYSSLDVLEDLTTEQADANWYLPFKVVDSCVMTRIQEYMETMPVQSGEAEVPSALVGAITKALCYINRLKNFNVAIQNESKESASRLETRVLILAASTDQSAAYVPLMNAIFSAQKLKVTIDVCKVSGPETVFLQQAAHLTGGSFMHLEQREALLQYLIMCFLPPPSVRSVITAPSADHVDLRAACFCHRDVVDIGFVCSVCLSIFCQPVPVCSTCRTKFPMQTLKKLSSLRSISMVPARHSNGTNGKAASSPLVNGSV